MSTRLRNVARTPGVPACASAWSNAYPALRAAAGLSAFVAAYLALGWVATGLRLGRAEVVAYFPASGLAVCAATAGRGGRRYAVLVAVLVGTVALRSSWGSSTGVAVAFALGNVFEAFVFAAVAERVPETLHLGTRDGVTRFIAAAVVAAGAGALVAVSTLFVWTTLPEPFDVMLLVRLGANALGIVSVAPAVLLGRRALSGFDARRRREALLFAAVLVATVHVGFGDTLVGRAVVSSVAIAVLLGGVVRLDGCAAVLGPLLLVPMSLWYTTRHQGPWAALAGSAMTQVFSAQIYGLTASAGAWLVAGLVGDRASSARALEESNRCLERRVAERTAELAELQAVTALVAETRALDDILDAVLPRLRGLLRADGVRVLLVDAETAQLTCRRCVGFDRLTCADLPIPAGWTTNGARLPSIHARLSSRAGQSADGGHDDECAGRNARAALVASGKPLGVLEATFATAIPTASDELVSLMRCIAEPVASAIERANAEAQLAAANAELSDQARRAAAAAAVSQALVDASLDLAGTACSIAREVSNAIGDVCVVALLADDNSSVVPCAVHAADPTILSAARDAFSNVVLARGDTGLIGRALSRGTAVRASGDSACAPFAPSSKPGAFLDAAQMRSAAVAPMHSNAEIVGTLSIFRRAGHDAYSSEDVLFLQDLADRAGLAIANAWLLEERRRAELSLRESEERFRATFDHAPTAAAVVSLAPRQFGQLLRVNPALCKLTGHSESRLLAMRERDLLHPDEDITDEERQDLLAATDEHECLERRYLRADGTTIWTRLDASRLPGDETPRAVLHIEDITRSKETTAALERRALEDPLTGLVNRHGIVARLGEMIAALDGQTGLAVLYVDLDRFKEINDTLGHAIGDAVLVEVAQRLGRVVRAPDTAARLGGDEFVVACAGITDDNHAIRIAERVEAALNEPVEVSGELVDIGASIGLTTTRHSSADPADLLQRADVAMYEAKRHGRHGWTFYTPALRHAPAQGGTVEGELRRALDQQWLVLHYQPIIDIEEGRITAVEALLRIAHPTRGLIYPSAFIDVAERSDLIVDVSGWVLSEACRQLQRWHETCDLRMAVNISGRDASSGALAATVLDAAHRAGVEPAHLSLELTERVLIDATAPASDDLSQLADSGVDLAIDDFGTGYSSLTYLQHFPVSTVKIDRSFINAITTSSRDRAIVHAITALAEALDITVVAEGVESADQLAALRALGCRHAQGFHLGRPQAADAITAILTNATVRLPAGKE